MENIITYKLFLNGKVQGVGMRYFILRTAKRFGIKGRVRNLYTGQVEAIVQTKKSVMDEFITYIKKNSPGYIETIDLEEIFGSETYKTYKVKIF